MPPIKVVHLIDGLTMGGAEMMLYKVVSRMDRTKFEGVVIAFMEEGPVRKMIEEAGVPVLSLGMAQGKPSAKAFFTLVNLLRRERPAVLQTWSKTADLIGLLAGRRAKVPAILWNIRSSRKQKGQYSRLTATAEALCARLSRLPRLIVANSQMGIEAYSEIGYRPKEWRMLPNGFDIGQYAPDELARGWLRAELGVPDDTFLVGNVGRYHVMKDQPSFVRAAHIFSQKHPDAHYVLVGPGNDVQNEELQAVLKEGGAGANIHLLGERSDVPRISAGLDLFALTSVSEGFPNVVGEAMACGVPCAVTNVGDTAIVVGDTGIVVPPSDPTAMAQAWSQFVEMGEAARRAQGRAARARILENYDLETIVNRYESLYAEMAGENGKRR